MKNRNFEETHFMMHEKILQDVQSSQILICHYFTDSMKLFFSFSVHRSCLFSLLKDHFPKWVSISEKNVTCQKERLSFLSKKVIFLTKKGNFGRAPVKWTTNWMVILLQIVFFKLFPSNSVGISTWLVECYFIDLNLNCTE